MISCIHTHCIHNKDACCILDTVSKVTNLTQENIKCLYYEEQKKEKKISKLPSSL